ncbi:MAG: hypothetical protein AB4911_05980 [Oscillochloridaceae bacterium umkhey_bin13]
MSILDPQLLRRELLLAQAIDNQLDGLVAQATFTMLILGPKTSLEESQLRNLLNVAVRYPQVEVIANFIRYQIGRKERDWGVKPGDFGHAVISDLYGKVHDLAVVAITEVKLKLTEFAEQEQAELASKSLDQQVKAQQLEQIQSQLKHDLAAADQLTPRAYAKLIPLYLGYLSRSFYFYKKMQDKSDKERDPAYQQEALKLLQQVAKNQQKEVKDAR